MLSIAIALAAAASQTPSASLPAWVAEVNRRIDNHMIHPTNGDTGMAVVTFRRGEDGRPIDVKAKSGSPALSRAAVQTIKAVGVLPAMPKSMASNQRVALHFLVGRVGYENDFMKAENAMMAAADKANTALAAQMAAVPGEGTELASSKPR